MKTLLFMTFLVSLVYSKNFPKLYSQLGTPLFEQESNFDSLSHLPQFKSKQKLFTEYTLKSQEARLHGKQIDEQRIGEKNTPKAYLKELRTLQKIHDKILKLYKQSLYASINDNNTSAFNHLLKTPLPFIVSDIRLKEKVVSYYKKTKTHSVLYLDKLSNDLSLDEDSFSYTNEVFQLSKKEQKVQERSSIDTFIPDSKRKNPVDVISVKTEDGFDLFLENHAYYDVTIYLKALKLENLSSSEKLPFIGSFPAQSRTKIMHFSIINPQVQSLYQTTYKANIGRINPDYETSYVYALPYTRGNTHALTQGFNGKQTHKGTSRYALDFKMPIGTDVHAMRSGVVVALESKHSKNGFSPEYKDKSNYIIIQHEDGTMAMYGHLKQNGVKVSLGQDVYKHQKIGLSGNTGYSSGPHLHVHITATKDYASGPTSIPFIFKSAKGKIDSPQEQTEYKAK